MTYEETLTGLFAILAQSNASDSDDAQEWQKTNDSAQSSYARPDGDGHYSSHYSGQGIYGHVWNAIASIAGEEILYAYVNYGELDLSLANRN